MIDYLPPGKLICGIGENCRYVQAMGGFWEPDKARIRAVISLIGNYSGMKAALKPESRQAGKA